MLEPGLRLTVSVGTLVPCTKCKGDGYVVQEGIRSTGALTGAPYCEPVLCSICEGKCVQRVKPCAQICTCCGQTCDGIAHQWGRHSTLGGSHWVTPVQPKDRR